jgi:SulP family sulfate permease
MTTGFRRGSRDESIGAPRMKNQFDRGQHSLPERSLPSGMAGPIDESGQSLPVAGGLQTGVPAIPPRLRARSPIIRPLAGFSGRYFLPDILAGLMLAAIAIPEQMATAKLGGFPPEAGFVAFVAATAAFVVFGASRYISVGADSTITPIFAAGLALIVSPGLPAYGALAATLGLLVGAMLLAAGSLRLGWIANLLSVPVTTGFLAGIAVHIAVSQLPTALGIQASHGDLLEQLTSLMARAGHANPVTLAMALGVLAITLLSERVSRRIPGALIGLVLAGGAAFVLKDGGTSIAMLGPLAPATLSAGIALPHLPDVIRLVPLALIVSLVIMVQSAATARSFPSPVEALSDFDRDLVGVGAANILAAVAGTFPVNASPPRTAIAVETGSHSQVSGLAAAALVAVLAVFGSNLLAHIPGAALCGVLLYVSWRITRIGTMLTVLRQSKGEFGLIAATLLAIVVLPIEIGVGLGILLSLLQGMWTATRTRLIELVNVPGTTVWWPPGGDIGGRTLQGVRVVAFQAPLSFLNAEEFRADLTGLLAQVPLKLVVLEAASIVEIDFTAAQVLREGAHKFHEAGILFAIARLESVRALHALSRFGVMNELGDGFLFRTVDEAVKALAPDAAPRNAPQ